MVKEEWNAIIKAKLKEGISIDDLKHEYAPGIVLEPNVMDSDLAAYDHIVSVHQPWINMAVIERGSTLEKNTRALQALDQGANGLSIVLSPQDAVIDILKDILTRYLEVRIECSQLSKQELDTQKASLNITDFPNVRWVSEHAAYEEIRITRKERIQSIQECLHNIDAQSQVDIIVTMSKNILFEIASLRAIRALIDEKGISVFKIICKYDIEGSNELGDYNLIEKTYKIISGILGGANAILTTYNGDEDSRLTLNIHNVLDLESGMKSVLDPLGGAYYIEKLTGEIIRQVKSES